MSEYIKSEDIGSSQPILHREDKIEVFNPATLEKIGEVKVFNKEDVKRAVQSAREAFLGWSALSFKDRASYLYRVRDLILDNREKIIDTICSETGKVMGDTLVEILYVSDIIGFYGKRAKSF
jgi:acyl-CoA reductase-like NAD-dependent aldehyde dehydrogenase